MKLCIIGAGTAGLCCARHALQNYIEPTIFEQTGKIGGTWVYTDEIGTDKYGIDVHSSMYRKLRTNLPKEIMGYPDFPIMKYDKSYVPSQCINEFLEKYAEHFQLMTHIKFLHYVVRILPRGKEWEVIVKNVQNNCTYIHYFDFVMICNGHYHTPSMPVIPGSDVFKGKQSHSHDFRCIEIFQDEKILVIGAGPSGMDLCHQISKLASSVIISHHLPEKPNTKFRSNVSHKPDVKALYENGAYFEDGTYDTFSAIFYCTGYKYAFPFISVDSGIYVDDNYIKPLFKHCINIKYPTMAFIGLPFYVCAAQMMDLQARFVIKYFSRKISLPSTYDMYNTTNAEMEDRWKNGLRKRHAHMMGPTQIKYYSDLATTADIESIKPVMTKLHNESSQRFLDDLVNFRDDLFQIVDDETFVKCS